MSRAMTAPTADAPAQVLRAVLWMVGAVLSFTAMAVSGREMSFELQPIEIMMYRSIIGLVIVLLVGGSFGTLRQITMHRFGWQVARNLCHFSGQFLWFWAITLLSLAEVFAVEFTGPLWALVLSSLILGERLTRNRVLAGCVGFIGILIVTRPGFETLDTGLLVAALAAFCLAGAVVMTRRLTRSESLTCILFWMAFLQTILGVVLAGADGQIALPSMANLHWLFLLGSGGLLAHFCLTKALTIAPAAVVLPVDFARLPLIAVIGMLAYGERVDIWVFVGAAVIFAANYVNLLVESRMGKRASPPPSL